MKKMITDKKSRDIISAGLSRIFDELESAGYSVAGIVAVSIPADSTRSASIDFLLHKESVRLDGSAKQCDEESFLSDAATALATARRQ